MPAASYAQPVDIRMQIQKIYIGQGLSELTPVEIVGYEVDEAGSPLALDNGQFTDSDYDGYLDSDVNELKGWSVFDTWYAKGGLQLDAFKKDDNIIIACRGRKV